MADNYDKMGDLARDFFLKEDQEQIIKRWKTEYDEKYIYITYFSQKLKIDRQSAQLSYCEMPAENEYYTDRFNWPSMVVFDLLTHSAFRPHASGGWATVSSLGGIIGAGHDVMLDHDIIAERLGKDTAALEKACIRLNGEKMNKGDVSYAIPVFEDFRIWFQFWEADDEFPASIKCLFDENALQYMHYETLWYAMSEMFDRLRFLMEK